MKQPHISLTIDSDFNNVQLVGITIRSLAMHFGLSSQAANEVEIAVVEGTNNAIEHAYQNQPGHEVIITVEKHAEAISIQIRDSGLTMPSFTIPKPQFDPEDPETLPDGGFGLFIINQVMDTVNYTSEGDHNTLIMQKRVSSHR